MHGLGDNPEITPAERIAIWQASIERANRVRDFMEQIGDDVLKEIENDMIADLITIDALKTEERDKLCMYLKWFVTFRIKLREMVLTGEADLNKIRGEKVYARGEKKEFY
jgi:hypothetical protein